MANSTNTTDIIKSLSTAAADSQAVKNKLLKQMSDYALHQAILSEDDSVFEKVIKSYMDAVKEYQTAFITGEIPTLWQTYFDEVVSWYESEKKISSWHTATQRNYDNSKSIVPIDVVDQESWRRDIASQNLVNKAGLRIVLVSVNASKTEITVTYSKPDGSLTKRQIYRSLLDNFSYTSRLVNDTEHKYPIKVLANMNFTSQSIKEQIVTRLSLVNRVIFKTIDEIQIYKSELDLAKQFLEKCTSYYQIAIDNYFNGLNIDPPSEKDN